MKIIILGAGKIGVTLADQLSAENHEITIVDISDSVLSTISTAMDVQTVQGDATTVEALNEAGVSAADLAIAVMHTDEENLLACLVAKKLGVKNTIARIRNPEHVASIRLLKDDLGLSLALNPEQSSAMEITRLLRAPSATKIDTFSRGRVELHKFIIAEGNVLDGMTLIDVGKQFTGVLICVVERGQNVFIPNGSFVLKSGDRLSIVARPKVAQKFYKQIGMQTNSLKNIMLLGGGRISYYIARQMLEFGAAVTIIEQDIETCETLKDLLPEATVIHGDATDEALLASEGLSQMDAVCSLTGIDEANALLSLHVKRNSKAKTITKINRMAFSQVIKSMDLGSVIHPRYVAADGIVRYVRAMENSKGSNVETLYKIVGNQAEALEFHVTDSSVLCGIPLMDLPIRKNILIAAITRQGKVITPGGRDTIEPDDNVIVISGITGLNNLDDILEKRR